MSIIINNEYSHNVYEGYVGDNEIQISKEDGKSKEENNEKVI